MGILFIVGAITGYFRASQGDQIEVLNDATSQSFQHGERPCAHRMSQVAMADGVGNKAEKYLLQSFFSAK
jgi:hypothetical protein